jgi:hypothetical protein
MSKRWWTDSFSQYTHTHTHIYTFKFGGNNENVVKQYHLIDCQNSLIASDIILWVVYLSSDNLIFQHPVALMHQGIRARLRRTKHKRNTAWTQRYESIVSGVWAYILKRRRRRTAVACKYTDIRANKCGGFNRLTVPWGWPYRAETCRNSKIKCNFNDILGNLNVIVMAFKIKVYVALEMKTSGRVISSDKLRFLRFHVFQDETISTLPYTLFIFCFSHCPYDINQWLRAS